MSDGFTIIESEDLARRQRRVGTVVLLAAIILLVSLAGRLCYLNAAMEPRLRPLIDRQQRTQLSVPARRGTIFDRHGRVLADSRDLPSLFADPALINQFARSAARIADALNMDAGEVEDRLRHGESPRFSVIRRRVTEDQARTVMQLGIRGVATFREGKREYPMGSTLAHVLGFVGDDEQGLGGVEQRFDAHLRGQDGTRSALCNVRRVSLCPTDEPSRDPLDGGHLVLTIDSVIQEFAERALDRQIEEFEAHSGVSLVISPKTGEVLAMVSRPTFDPGDYTSYSADNRRNLAVTQPVEPGSTFKPFILGAALAAGVIGPNDRIDCGQGQRYFGRRLVHDTHPRGWLDLEDVVVKSSNIGMATLGELLGDSAMRLAVRNFGFGDRTDVGLPGESRGLLTPSSRWNSYSTVSVSFGQEIAVTPIQLATSFCSLVNGGVLLKPRIVRALLSSDGAVMELHDQPQPVRRVLSNEIARYIQNKVLVKVVTHGGGIDAALPDYQVLGKTGTAQMAWPDRGGYEPGAYVSSFIGAAPAENPEVVVLVMVYRPNAAIGYYGRRVAAPAVRSILAGTLAYLQQK